ncbi:MAG: endonuclease, partial [Proteobacteria bacterium]|nr:endonuclease [Pseudomonadota bacterium]
MKPITLGALLLTAVFWSNHAIAEPDPGYYDSVDTSSAQAARKTLHEIIDDHVRIPYTDNLTDTWDVLEMADQSQDDPNGIITIYRNAIYIKQHGGNDFYNREHTWPRSYGFPDDHPGNYPFTDMHHLFLADADYNFSRSNIPYANCDASCIELVTDNNDGRGGASGPFPGDSNWMDGEFTDGRWQVWRERRGDIARAMLYMDIRYAGGTHSVTGDAEPDLILTNDRSLIDQGNTGNNTSVAYMGLLSVLLQWHKDDPVDAIERQHHEAVSAFQENRNPFIDHPEYADCVFGDICKTVVGECDSNFVNLVEQTIIVTPTGDDDTANIQCALNTAADDGYPTVKMTADTYYIGGIIVENFTGTLEGTKKTSTIISVLDNSINCTAMQSAGQTSAVIKFIRGEPRIRFMTISASQPCLSNLRIQNLLHFTGTSANDNSCSNDVIFGAVDRMSIDGMDVNFGPLQAISVMAEGNALGGCKDTLLGTFKLNRSEIFNTLTGIATSLKAGAQVDINFNQFQGNA